MKATLKLLTLLFVIFASPSAAVAGEPDFTVYPGDVLQITVWKEEGLDKEVIVLPDNTITFPLVGTISVAGMTPGHVQAAIKDKLKDSVPDASVTVAVKSPQGHTASVLGQVTKPGSFVMAQQLTVMQALSQAGGLTPYASEGSIVILRQENGKKTSIPFPYNDVARGRNMEKNIVLRPGDVVVVPTAGLF